MANQAAFLGVLGLDRMVLQLAELADVVQHDRGDDHTLVEGRVQVLVIIAVVLDQASATLVMLQTCSSRPAV